MIFTIVLYFLALCGAASLGGIATALISDLRDKNRRELNRLIDAENTNAKVRFLAKAAQRHKVPPAAALEWAKTNEHKFDLDADDADFEVAKMVASFEHLIVRPCGNCKVCS